MKGDTLDQNGNCKVCGSKPYCRHDIGSSGHDSVDDFRLICPKCGEIDQFIHVDLCGNDIETCPWCGQTASQNGTEQYLVCVWFADGISCKNPIKKDWNKIHRVDHVDIEEDPAGEDGNVYVATCGERLVGWENSASPIAQTDTLEEAQKIGLEFCKICF